MAERNRTKYTYDPLSRRDTLTRGNATTTVFDFDLASRLSSLNHNLGGTNHDATFSFVYTDASQLASRQSSNDALAAWTVIPRSDTYTANGLNQYSSVTGITYNHDANGNLQSNGARTFSYDLENRLTAVTGTPSMTLGYDPLGRLKQTASGGITTDYLYEGDRLIAEYNGSTLLRRYVHGPGVDEPIVWYEGTGLNDRRWLHADERGSVIAETNGSGTATVYSYGPYGEPSNWVGSRFRYTGQIMLPEVGLYHYKARVYDPVHGRFLQTDPIGYEDDFNLYAYVKNDPLNNLDPSGELCVPCITGLVGAAFAAAGEGIKQYKAGQFDGGKLAAAALKGGAIGFGAGAGGAAAAMYKGANAIAIAAGSAAGAGIADLTTSQAVDVMTGQMDISEVQLGTSEIEGALKSAALELAGIPGGRVGAEVTDGVRALAAGTHGVARGTSTEIGTAVGSNAAGETAGSIATDAAEAVACNDRGNCQ